MLPRLQRLRRGRGLPKGQRGVHLHRHDAVSTFSDSLKDLADTAALELVSQYLGQFLRLRQTTRAVMRRRNPEPRQLQRMDPVLTESANL